VTFTDLACPVTRATRDAMPADPFRLAEAPTARARCGPYWDVVVKARHAVERFERVGTLDVLGLVRELVAGSVWVDLVRARPAASISVLAMSTARVVALLEEELLEESLVEVAIHASERPDDGLRIAPAVGIDESRESK